MTENRTGGRFESALRAGKFVVTAEVTPPDSANPQDVVAAAKVLGRMADTLNVTDGSGAHCHISSVAACAILNQAGYEVIFQMSCRDPIHQPQYIVTTALKRQLQMPADSLVMKKLY